jgi:hypothetical protein
MFPCMRCGPILLLTSVLILQRIPKSEAFLSPTLRLPGKRSVASLRRTASVLPVHPRLARRTRRSLQGPRCKVEVQDDSDVTIVPSVPLHDIICTDYDCGPSTILGSLVSAGNFQNVGSLSLYIFCKVCWSFSAAT